MNEIAFCFCLMEMAKKKKPRNPKTQMHLLICIYAHVYTHINTQHILSCPPGQFRSWDTNTFKRKSMAKQKTNNNNKKQSPIEKNRSKKRFTERTSRETQETPHCPREYTFSEQLKRLQRSI